MENLYGSQWLLTKLPLVVSISIIVFLTICLVWIGREVFEGMGYNVSYAAQIGDIFLGFIILIGAMVLQRAPVLPGWTTSWWFHLAVLAVAIGIGYFGNKVPAPMIVDKFHNVFVVPLFVYFLATVAPVIWYGGTRMEWSAAVSCFAIWLALLVFDAMAGRLPQQEYQYKKYGIRLQAWEGKFSWLPPK